MYDGELIDFNAEYELNYILKNNLSVRKRESISNRDILVEIGNDYKSDKKVRMVYHRSDFYDYVNSHSKYFDLETYVW